MPIILIGLIIYFVFLLGFAIFSAFAVYHLFSFSYAGDLCRPFAIAYLLISGGVILTSLVLVLSSMLS